MENLEFLNNLTDSVCAFNSDKQIVFKNNLFVSEFSGFSSFERLKKRFNFNLCFLSSDSFTNVTPIDIILKNKENVHTICSFQNLKEEYKYYYIYSFDFDKYKILVFKDVTSSQELIGLKDKYFKLENNYNDVKETADKFLKQQELSQTQVLKMGIINRISLVIRETNDIETVLSSALEEINNLIGSYKTYFSMKEKNSFEIKYCVNCSDIGVITQYEDDIISKIKNKEIVVSSCIKEFHNSSEILPRGVTRVIIPVYNKNKLLGIIVTFTKHKFNLEDNSEILQSISVQLASSIIQAGLIHQLNKKNKKLEITLKELKETQIQLINTEKMASVGQLVSGVAHEINTPLASINSNSSMISKLIKDKQSLDKNQLEILTELNDIDIEAVQRISNIVKSLKRFVRLDEAELQEADINKELDLTLKLMAHELKNNIKVVKNYAQLPNLMCRVNMLNQVFMNLLVNACHSILNSDKDGIIEIITSYDDVNLIVKIKDNGCGIPQNQQNKIFNVGYTTKKIGMGTGLGLSISKKIVELHKGTISFVSKEDVGTEFIVSIPLNLKS
ncbi:MAG: GAF domain-containing sensor histidine kinase [Cyanobacteria bacterium SIG29]|nr:GAF domain-containing sensor histidine kinase [Cyanobacteria bacterium SIG29]